MGDDGEVRGEAGNGGAANEVALAEVERWRAATAGPLVDGSVLQGLVADVAPIGQCVLSPAGHVLDLNAALASFLRMDRSAVIGRSVQLFMPGLDLASTPDTDSAGIELLLQQRGGDQLPARAYLSTIALPGQVEQWRVLQVLDIRREKTALAEAADAHRDLELRLRHDPLTGLLTRDAVIAELTTALAADSSGQGVATVFLDVDNFKEINDGLSHAAGDEVLRQVAARLRGALRSSDQIGRFGGDEFVCVLPGLPTPEAALGRAVALSRSVAGDAMDIDGRPVFVSLSLGVSHTDASVEPEEFLQEADVALHVAKDSGRNMAVLFDERMRESSRADRELADRLRAGLADRSFQAWYQPQVDLRTGGVVAYELLARWDAGGGVPIPAAEYLRVAEDRGLLAEIGEQVIRQAVPVLNGLPDEVQLAINAAPQEICRARFLSDLAATLEEFRVQPERIVIEVPERAMRDLGPACRAIRRAADLGMSVYIDDFGSGFSSLGHLRDEPITGIKLAAELGALVGQPGGQSTDRVVAGLAGLAEGLGIVRVAKSVETAEQEQALLTLGWSRAQGSRYGMPRPGIG